MRARIVPLATILAMLFGPIAPVEADQSDIRASDNAVSLEVGASHLDYAETFRGTTLDSEKGWLPTATLGVGVLANDNAAGLLRNLYLHLDLTGSIGSTDYDGALCSISGTCVPATTTTDDAMFGASLQAGRAFPLSDTVMLIPYGQIDYRYWDRQVGGAGNASETYTNWAALGGLMAQASIAPRWVLSVSAAAGTTFESTMNDGFADYALGSAFIWQTKARLGLRIAPRLEWTGTVGFTHFEFGQSPVVFEPGNAFCASGCFKPHSNTDQLSLTSGIAYQF